MRIDASRNRDMDVFREGDLKRIVEEYGRGREWIMIYTCFQL